MILIRGGTVVDGTGAPARVADLGICDGRIVAIDTAAARAYPGVHAVLTGDDLPGIIAGLGGTFRRRVWEPPEPPEQLQQPQQPQQPQRPPPRTPHWIACAPSR